MATEFTKVLYLPDILQNCCNQPSISRYFTAQAPRFPLLGHCILDEHLVCQVREVLRLAVGEKV